MDREICVSHFGVRVGDYLCETPAPRYVNVSVNEKVKDPLTRIKDNNKGKGDKALRKLRLPSVHR